ncbi:MAG: hypothetical protein AAFX50_19105 [Acidobacteriota bacterium]
MPVRPHDATPPSSCTAPDMDCRVHRPGLVGVTAGQRAAEPPGPRRTDVAAPLYSIRVPRVASRVCCPICTSSFVAAGPTGHLDDRPICDLCLLERETQLGLVLALVAVTRSYGGGWPQDELEEEHARIELMAFARIYDAKASRFAPARPVDPDWMWPDAGVG